VLDNATSFSSFYWPRFNTVECIQLYCEQILR